MCSDNAQPQKHQRTILGDRESFDEVQDSVLTLMRDFGFSDHDLFSIRVAFEEALANALIHGHQGDVGHEINVTWLVTDEFIEIEVIDQGMGYNPETIPDPTLAMIHAFMNEVHVNDRGNHVRMIRHKTEE